MFKFMQNIMGAVAELERELTVEQIRKGMAKGKRYGISFGKPVGRPPRGIPASFKKYPMWKDGDIKATDFARLLELVGRCFASIYMCI